MITILSYLIIGHLLGDFILQPKKLLDWKERSFMGIFAHSLIHWALCLLLLLPVLLLFKNNILILTGFIVITHAVIDISKIHYDKAHTARVKPFLVDQMLHLISIFMLLFLFKPMEINFPDYLGYDIYTSFALQSFIIITILSTVTYPIFKYQKELESKKNPKLKIDSAEILVRFLAVLAFYFIFLNFFR